MKIDVRLADPAERDVLLGFIERMGFNPRDARTWDALDMTAMTAWHGNELVGAVPMEPRRLQLGSGAVVQVAHETVAAVHPDHRGRGIGSRLQEEIRRNPPAGAGWAALFRELPESPAYRFYLANGFFPALHIQSWLHDDPGSLAAGECGVHDADDPELDWDELERLWSREWPGRSGGLVDRRWRPLSGWLGVHPYRHRYRFHVAVAHVGQRLSGYALLCVGTLHSATPRVDISEIVVEGDDETLVERLVRGVASWAAPRRFAPLRWSVAESHRHAGIARRLGFEPRWSFDLLVRPLEGSTTVLPAGSSSQWRYVGIDYI